MNNPTALQTFQIYSHYRVYWIVRWNRLVRHWHWMHRLMQIRQANRLTRISQWNQIWWLSRLTRLCQHPPMELTRQLRLLLQLESDIASQALKRMAPARLTLVRLALALVLPTLVEFKSNWRIVAPLLRVHRTWTSVLTFQIGHAHSRRAARNEFAVHLLGCCGKFRHESSRSASIFLSVSSCHTCRTSPKSVCVVQIVKWS